MSSLFEKGYYALFLIFNLFLKMLRRLLGRRFYGVNFKIVLLNVTSPQDNDADDGGVDCNSSIPTE